MSWVLELPMSLHEVPKRPKTAKISEVDAITRCFFMILVGYRSVGVSHCLLSDKKFDG